MTLKYKDKKLFLDDLDLEKIVKEYGSPLFVYSYNSMKDNFMAYNEVLHDTDHLICFALKTNSNYRLIKELAKLGAGADTVSGGEIFRALKAGFSPNKIVYAGVGKTKAEIDYAINSEILMFNVESTAELNVINERAMKLNKKVAISIRINPDVDPKTHPYISTGLAEHKFGIDIKEAEKVYKYARNLEAIKPIGVHMHLGSQLLDILPYHEAFEKIFSLYMRLKKIDITLKYLNIGGGLGISYDPEKHKAPTPYDLVEGSIKDNIKKENLTLILEPGRSIMGNAGIMITQVLYNKKTKNKNFVIVDAGMNDLARPSLYNAYHEIAPLKKESAEKKIADIVGPICESTDFLAKEREIESVNEGNYLVVKTAGAYCFSMSSNYNSRLKPAEVMIKDGKAVLIRKRDIFEDLIRNEIV
ncbi:diaminopimelate decarboxylase [bacterium]